MLIESRLPSAEEYYRRQRVNLLGDGVWKLGFCPFHNDPKPGRTLSVHLKRGAFLCLHCGVQGREFIQFHQLRYGYSFEKAAQRLGAWREDK